MADDPGFFGDGDRLSYPEADDLVDRYIEARTGDRDQTTSRDVLQWAGVPVSAHNQTRIHDALTRTCIETDLNWAGRTVFELPADHD